MLQEDTLPYSGPYRVSSTDSDPEDWIIKRRIVQMTQFCEQARLAVPVGMAVSLIVTVALWKPVPLPLLLGWAIPFQVIQVLRLLLFRSFLRARQSSDDTLVLTYGKWFLMGSCLTAMLWGFGAALFFPFGNTAHQVLLVAMVAGVGASVASAYAPLRECYIPAVVLVGAPMCACLLMQWDMTSVPLSLAGILYIAFLLGTARTAHDMLAESIRLRFEKDRLLEQVERSRLELEKTVDDRTAELSARNEELSREIREKTAAQEALRNSEEQLSRAQHIARVGSWGMDLDDGRFTWSLEMFRILEVDPNECKPSLATLLQHVHPDDVGLVARVHGDNLIDASSHGAEYRLLMPDGREKCVQSRTEIVFDESGRPVRAVGTLQDVTELRVAEASLFLTQVALDHVTEATFLFDEQARFRYVNESACRFMGCTKEELLGKALGNTACSPLIDNWERHWELLKHEKALAFESMHRTTDGRELPVEINANCFEYKGIPYYWAFARDVTERKRAQEEILAWERRELQSQKLESLGALAGGIAHDFNNLLTAVLGNLELALSDPLMSSQARARLQRAVAAGQRAVAVTRQMLAYSGKGKFVLVKVSLSKLVEEESPLLKSLVQPRGSLSFDLDPTVPPTEADPSHLRQLIANLVTNASEALGNAPLKICVSTGVAYCDEGTLNSSRLEEKPHPGHYVYVQVTDSGSGMDQHTLQRLFEPFYSTKLMGRGLGMSAVMGIVRGHGGAIQVESTVGQGTTVRVWFPVSERFQSHTNPQESSNPVSDTCGQPSILGTLLIIDDEDIVREVCKEMLEHCGYRVLCAADSQQGVEMLQRYARDIDCVILDLSMPGKDGLETLEEIRRFGPGVKVILSSGFNINEAVRRFAGKGLSGFLQKPFNMQTLLARVDEIMGSGR
jgi:PAS domain S-box-containing protein